VTHCWECLSYDFIRSYESQETTNPADSSASTIESSFTLQSVHDAALKQLKDMHCLSPADYQRVEGANRLQDILESTAFRDASARIKTEKSRISLKSLLERLGKFEPAIDMLAQSMPQVFGLSLVGIIWGSLKILLTVSRQLPLHSLYCRVSEQCPDLAQHR
jgi:hypothetical protein